MDGTDDRATWAVAATLTVKDELVLEVRPVLAAVMVKVPAVSKTRLLKTAWPEAFVVTEVVDEGSKEPELSVTLTVTPDWDTALLPESRSCTTGAVIATPATTLTGLVVNASCVAGPAAPAGAVPSTANEPVSSPTPRAMATATLPNADLRPLRDVDDDMYISPRLPPGPGTPPAGRFCDSATRAHFRAGRKRRLERASALIPPGSGSTAILGRTSAGAHPKPARHQIESVSTLST